MVESNNGWYIKREDRKYLTYATKEEREAELAKYPYLYDSYLRNVPATVTVGWPEKAMERLKRWIAGERVFPE